MPRKPPFGAASLYVHFQPVMTRAFPLLDDIPEAMQARLDQLARPWEVSIAARLAGLKRLLDEEMRQAEPAL